MNKKVVFLPYDMDTAIGINNEGSLVFGYGLEDTDQQGGENVFNGQDSVLWCNLRDTFGAEIKAMYTTLRASGHFSYDEVERRFEEHQSKWPEAVFNEDAFFKYLRPLIDDGDTTYLPMLLGSKEQQRKWWLYNRFRYMDSKYNTADSLTDRMLIRGNSVANITITPYADIYTTIRWGSTITQHRGVRNTAYLHTCPLDSLGDTDIYIYSAGQISDLGDLSGLNISFADFHSGIKLRNIKIGDSSSSYNNQLLRSLNIGNLKLLKKLDARNCSGLGTANENYPAQKNVDLSGCLGIEEVYFDGTNIGSVSLPNGGVLKKLHLPGTITNLTIRNQSGITEFVCPDFSHITTLFLEGTGSGINIPTIVAALPYTEVIPEGAENPSTSNWFESSGNGYVKSSDTTVNANKTYYIRPTRLRLFNYRWDFQNIAAVHSFLDMFDGMGGMDQNGDNTEQAQIFATVHVPSATGDEIDSVTARYPDITVDADTASYYLRYYSQDGNTLLYTETVSKGQNGTYSGTPTKASTAQYTYTFAGWSTTKNNTAATSGALNNIQNNKDVYAAFTATTRTYTINFVKDSVDGGGTLLTLTVPYGQVPSYIGSTPTSTRTDGSGNALTFEGWYPALTAVTGNTTYTATFAGHYTIQFVRAAEDGGGVLQTLTDVTTGTMPVYTGATPTTTKTDYSYRFMGWTPTIVAATGNATYTATFAAILGYTRPFIDRTIITAENSNASMIGDYAFVYCSKLTDASFPQVTSIGSYAFASCSSLTTISFPQVTSIWSSAFYNCFSLTTASFPQVTSIGSNAFYYCSKLTTISFPLATYIGNNVFYNCSKLTDASFPLATYIGNYAFAYCSSLTTISFPLATYIGNGAFTGCSSLTTISFPQVTSIGSNAFMNCSKLTTISFPLATYIGSGAFMGCSSLTTISFPQVTSIGSYAFASCASLTGMIINNEPSVAVLGNSNAFNNANNALIYVPDSMVASYQAATNWSYFSSRIKGISQLPN